MKTILIMCLFSLIGCSPFVNPKKEDFLTIPKTPYTGTQLKLDGYYYQKWDNGLKFMNITFLYSNGIVLRVGESGSLLEIDKFANQSNMNNYKQAKGFWGVVFINSNSIIYERWAGSEEGYRVYREEGKILNDTTFAITEASRMKQGKKTEVINVNWVYHFKSFSPKPDSTNNFVK